MVVCTCNPSYSGTKGQEDHEFKASLGKVSDNLSQKQNFKKGLQA
jgi:hypothetical protein